MVYMKIVQERMTIENCFLKLVSSIQRCPLKSIPYNREDSLYYICRWLIIRIPHDSNAAVII